MAASSSSTSSPTPGPVPKIDDSATYTRATRTERAALISRHYVAKWDLREMLRELVSNQMDEIYKFAAREPYRKSKRDVDVRAGPDEKHELKAGEFDFYIDGIEPVIIGRIRYDAAARQLRLINPGTIPKWALLIGGSSNMELTPEEQTTIVGRFGEGLKLAFLTACRLKKTMCVHTDGDIWTAAFRYDAVYEAAVLHYDLRVDRSLTDDTAKARAKQNVTVVINDISLAEWQGTPENNTGVHSFLSLMQAQVVNNDLMDPLAIQAKEAKYGRLLLAPHVLGKIYNNGVFITDQLRTRFGYDLVALTPNRDRGVLPDVHERRTATANVLGDIIEYATEHKANAPALATSWRGLIILIQALIHDGSEETVNLSDYCSRRRGKGSTKTADWLFEHWQDSREGRVDMKWGSGSERRPLVYPVNPEEAVELRARFKRDAISTHIYPMEVVSRQHAYIFHISRHYVTLDQRVTQLTALPGYDTLSSGQAAIRDSAVALAIRCDARLAPGGSGSRATTVVFREAPIDHVFQRGGNTYLSRLLLDLPHPQGKSKIAAALLTLIGADLSAMLAILAP